MIKKSVKFVLVLLLLIMLLLAAIPLLLQTRPFKNRLASFVEATVSKSLDATVAIGRIDGNFFTKLHVSDLILASEQDTIAAISALSLVYSPRHLLQKKIVFSSIVIDSSYLHIIQHADSSWIFRRHPAAQKQTVKSKPRESKPFAWTIQVDDCRLTNLNATITALDSLIPRHIDALSFELNGLYSEAKKRLNLSRLSLATTSPDIQIRNLVFQFEQDTSGIVLNNFQIDSRLNRIFAEVICAPDSSRRGMASVSTEPIDFSEFQFILPALSIKGQPSIKLESRLDNDRLYARLFIQNRQTKVSLAADINNFSSLLGDSISKEPTYHLTSTFRNVNLSEWTPHLSSEIVLNGNMDISGKGITISSADVSAIMNFYRCEIKNHTIDSLFGRARYFNGQGTAKLRLASSMGRAHIDANISNLFAKPRYQANITARAVDLAPAFSDSTMASDLNFDLFVSGTSFRLDDLVGSAELIMHSSRIYDVEVDSLDVRAAMAAHSIDILSFQAQSKVAQVRAGGHIGLLSNSDVTIHLTSDNLTALNRLLNADSLAGSIHLTAHVTGDPDSLHVSTSLKADSLLFNEFSIEALSITADIENRKNNFFSTAIAEVHQLGYGKMMFQDINLQTGLSPEKIDLHAELRHHQDIRARLYGEYWLNELPIIYLKQLDVDVRENRWRGGSDSTSIVFNKGEYIVTNLQIQNIIDDSVAAEIYADGTIRTDGPEDFLLRIHNFHLAPLGQFWKEHQEIDGLVNLELVFSGTAEHPELSVRTSIEDVLYKNFPLKKLQGNLFYKDEKLAADLLVIPRTDSLLLTGYIPAGFSLAERTFTLYDSRPFDLSLKASDVPIQNLAPLKQWFNKYSGFLSFDIHAENTLADMMPRGFIMLENGQLRNEEIGLAVDNLNTKINIQPGSILLEKFSAQQNKGTIDITGSAALHDRILPGIVHALQLNIRANDFYLSQKSEHEVQIDSDINISGPLDSLRMAGTLEVLRASIYRPAITKRKSAVKNPQIPLLVAALSAVEPELSSANTTIVIEAKRPAPAPPIMQNLRGTLKIKMPKNIWIKDDNLRVEIGGDVDLIKNAEFFELFGAVNILRGQYDFLARRFKLAEGTIRFQGGEKINPTVDVTAEYTFRDSNRNKKTVSLIVADRALSPEITFKLDDADITEGEAFSYILFNRSLQEVGSQNGQGSPQTGDLATDLVYGMMSADLTRRFSQQLGVDYIEIKGRDNLGAATFIVGKYITPNLFMSYEHSIGTLEEDQSPRVVTVEHQLRKYIFLQLVSGDTKTSGADIILKFDSE